VGFLLTDPQQLLFSDPNFAVLLREAGRALAALDMPLVLMMASTQQERRRIARYLDAGHVDGVLLISPHEGDPLPKTLVERNIPTVCCGRPLGMEGRISYVACDDFRGGAIMTSYLLRRGYRRVAMITGPGDTGAVDRLAGYQSVLDDIDERMVARGDYSRESGRRAMTELLDRKVPIDAVFAATDLMAAGAVEVLAARGLAVPGDIAVAGFDDSGLAESHKPPLTTMHQPFDRIADEMVRILLGMIEGDESAAVLLTPTLIERESA
jgi:DNA-binding LacI/PurR family transcriptional regulator